MKDWGLNQGSQTGTLLNLILLSFRYANKFGAIASEGKALFKTHKLHVLHSDLHK